MLDSMLEQQSHLQLARGVDLGTWSVNWAHPIGLIHATFPFRLGEMSGRKAEGNESLVASELAMSMIH
jgi:hypothetical protein